MANILDIITNPNPILRKRSGEVPDDKIRNADLTSFCADMAITMEKKDGVGLAAPQVGKNIRVITVATKDGTVCLINPVFTKKSLSKEWGQEGCLSVPRTFGDVKRHRQATCRFTDSEGNEKTIEAKGLMARILQHEIDHLDGILFIDKAKNIVKMDIDGGQKD